MPEAEPGHERAEGRAGAVPAITFERLETIEPVVLLAHMQDTRIASHLPLLDADWDLAKIDEFVEMKASHWMRFGLGHWAFLLDGEYGGWGGFQKEGEDWDFGMVLRPECFRWGKAIALKAFDWARNHTEIERVTMQLPLSRSPLVLPRLLDAKPLGIVEEGGVEFRKWVVPL